MMVVVWLIVIIVAVHAVLSIGPHLWTRLGQAGRPEKGLVIFVESTRFLGIRWGERSVADGLRKAGFEGQFVYWRFHSTWRGCLVVPVVAAGGLLRREAYDLAEFIADQRRQYPDRRLYVMGYSAGGYVAVRALELLADCAPVDGAAILAGAMSPGYDLQPAVRAVRGNLVVTSSLGDWMVLGVGMTVLGTCDRRHRPAMGMMGPRKSGDSEVCRIGWTPAMIKAGHLGGHFGAAASGFIARHVAAAMGIGAAEGREGPTR